MEPYLVLVVGDTLEIASATKKSIKAALPSAKILTTVVDEAARNAAAVLPDVVVTHSDAIDLLGAVRDAHPGVPIVVLGAGATAIDHGASEAFPADIDPAKIAVSVTSLADDFRLSRAHERRQVVLAIGAHPDDVEMGVGGILAAHRAAGDKVTVLTLSMGHRRGGAEVAKAEGAAAAAVIGAKLISEGAIELDDSIQSHIESVVAAVKPTIVYTHSINDRRDAHRAVHTATIAATPRVNTVASYHGTTGSPQFLPTEFVTIDEYIDDKLAMLACFAVGVERPSYLEPSFVLSTSRYWSQYGLGVHVEPLGVVRKSPLSPVTRGR